MSIQVQNISKSYQKNKAVEGISFDVKEGELFGLIGPDGAGKTTIFRILTTLLLANEGSATVAGFDVVKEYKAIRNSVGYMPGKFSLYQDLSVEENLTFFATIFGTTIEENYELIKDIYIQIEPFKTRRAGALSGGMKQKLGLACVLVHQPKVLILDEPTNGVDPISRREFWDILTQMRHNGMTILVATAYLDEGEKCDRLILMHNARVLDVATPHDIKADFADLEEAMIHRILATDAAVVEDNFGS